MEPLFWSLLLLLLGIFLIVLEVFIPSGGVLSVLAAVSVVAAVCVAFTGGMVQGASVLLAATLLVPLVIAAAIRWWPQTPMGRMILIPRPKSERDVLPDGKPYREREQLVGRFGRAKTPMLPSGAIVVGGRTFDAVSLGMAIEPGVPVKVVAIRTNRIVVAPAEEHQLQAARADDETAAEDVLSRPIDSLGLDPLDDPLA